MKQVNWQILLTFDLNLLSDEELHQRIEDARFRTVFVGRVELVASPEGLSLNHIVIRLDHLHMLVGVGRGDYLGTFIHI